MLKKIALAFLAVAVGLMGLAAIKPSTFHVSREMVIAAPPSSVFAHIEDFHKWQAWSPWAKLDPGATTAYEGAASGKGASFRWSGNDDVGEGRMTITDAVTDTSLAIRLDFVRPFSDTADVTFLLAPEGGGTRVTWSVGGERGFLERLMCFFMDIDAMIGSDYEKGLTSLKAVVEGGT